MDAKQQILKATKQLLLTHGLAKTTTKEIARAAGCAEGTLYNYFEHKEDLFLAVLEENLVSRVQIIDPEQIGDNSVQVNLEKLTHAALGLLEQIFPTSAALFADPTLLIHYRQKLKQHNRGPQYSYQYFEPYIRAEQQLGRIKADADPMAMGALLYGACLQYVFSKYFLGEEPFTLSEPQFVKNLVQTLLEGVLPKN